MADWAGLHGEVLVSILQKVRLIEDFVAFGSVCRSWREASRNKQRYLRPQIPWLMLPDRDNHRRICSINRDDLLPRNLLVPEMSDRRCIGLNYGWVLTVSRKGEMNLVHPLSRSQIQLPNQKTLDCYQQHKCRPSYITTSLAALSANPAASPSDYVVMIAYGRGMCMSYWRPGDQRWTRITNNQGSSYSDLIHCQDHFYALEYNGRVWTCSVSDPQDRSLLVDLTVPFYKGYIVESNGDLLVVAREIEWYYHEAPDDSEGEEIIEISEGEEEVARVYAEANHWTSEFEVCRLDLINGGCEPAKSLGDCAIFVGHNTSISLDSSEFPGLFKPNHIYFSDDHTEVYARAKKGGGKDMGSYNLEDGQMTRFKVEEDSFSRIDPPFWFIPSL